MWTILFQLFLALVKFFYCNAQINKTKSASITSKAGLNNIEISNNAMARIKKILLPHLEIQL